jgi:hypothetical protein
MLLHSQHRWRFLIYLSIYLVKIFNLSVYLSCEESMVWKMLLPNWILSLVRRWIPLWASKDAVRHQSMVCKWTPCVLINDFFILVTQCSYIYVLLCFLWSWTNSTDRFLISIYSAFFDSVIIIFPFRLLIFLLQLWLLQSILKAP